jgi:hypothetical protein
MSLSMGLGLEGSAKPELPYAVFDGTFGLMAWDGSTGFFPNATDMNSSGAVEIRFRAADTTAEQYLIGGAWGRPFSLQLKPYGLYLRMQCEGGGDDNIEYAITTTIPAGQWVVVKLLYQLGEAVELKTFVDGVLVNTHTEDHSGVPISLKAGDTYSVTPMLGGTYQTNWIKLFTGSIDYLKFATAPDLPWRYIWDLKGPPPYVGKDITDASNITAFQRISP